MSELKLADVLVRKRHKRGITQEELADYMGVSKAAVSKWEKAQSYPDITLLPQLATYFNISVDELLCYSPQLPKKEARKIYRHLAKAFAVKPFAVVLGECREVLHKYYSCFPLVFEVATLLANHYALAATPEEGVSALEESVSLCRRVLEESDDALLMKDALYLQCYCHLLLGRPEEVFALLGEDMHMPSLTEDALAAEAWGLAGSREKAQDITQCGIYAHLMPLVDALLRYAGFSGGAAETAWARAMELIRLFNMKVLNADIVARAYLIGAKLYAEQGNMDKALENLSIYTDFCIHGFLPFRLRGDDFLPSVEAWLDACTLGAAMPRDEKLVKQSLLQGLSAFPVFAALESDSRYQSLVDRLTLFASET